MAKVFEDLTNSLDDIPQDDFVKGSYIRGYCYEDTRGA